MRFFLVYLLFISVVYAEWGKVVYPLTTEPIDVVIPCSPKDLETLDACIDGIKKYGENIHRIIVVSKEPLTEKAEWFDETRYPFNKEEIALEIFQGDEQKAEEFLNHPKTRIGWIYQQLLKFYAFITIPQISSNILILDADVIFTKPVSFLGEQGEPLFALAAEYTQEYHEHASRLLPELKRVYPNKSGVTHHMLFQRPILEDLFGKIVEKHQTAPWKAMVHCIDLKDLYGSGLSEYEIYFNFTLLRTDQAILRPLRWMNIVQMRLLSIYSRHPYDFITCHSWARGLSSHFMTFHYDD